MTLISFDADEFCALLRQNVTRELADARERLTGLDLLGVELQAQCLPAKEAFARVVMAAREQGHPEMVLGAVAGALAYWMIEHVAMNASNPEGARHIALNNLANGMMGTARFVSNEKFSVLAKPAGRA